ncbi:hypothetical protein BH11ACT2_BH11ACT2_10880 [soil metagenome]
MKVAPTARKHVMKVSIALVAGLVAALTFAALPAQAAPIDPKDAPESISVLVRLKDGLKPVPGVGVEVKGGTFDEKFVTGDDGGVEVGLPAPGNYTVTLDESTFPSGSGHANVNPQKKSVQATNKQFPAFFLLDPSFAAIGSTAKPTAAPQTAAQNAADAAAFWGVFASKFVTGIIFGLLIALAAIGLSLIYGTTGLNNFAHGELVTFGALMAYTFSGILGWPAPIAIVGAIIAGGIFGWLQNAVIWKPLRKRGLGLVQLMIVTIGLSLALRYVFQFIWGAGRLALPNNPSTFLAIGPVKLGFTDVAGAVVSIVVLLAVAFILLRTKLGKATRAVADNRSLASASGIDVEGVIRTVWIGGAALAALAGVFIGYYQSLRFDTGASILLLIFAAVTLGGLGTAFGALIGSLVIGVFINLSTIWIPENLKYVAALLVMIIILLFRPQGILGRKDRIG